MINMNDNEKLTGVINRSLEAIATSESADGYWVSVADTTSYPSWDTNFNHGDHYFSFAVRYRNAGEDVDSDRLGLRNIAAALPVRYGFGEPDEVVRCHMGYEAKVRIA